MRPILSAPTCSVEELVFKPCIARYVHVWAQVCLRPTLCFTYAYINDYNLHI